MYTYTNRQTKKYKRERAVEPALGGRVFSGHPVVKQLSKS